jgi:catechol 2,3-dioxygenase-like lactoylglutathione lyase family enzyme
MPPGTLQHAMCFTHDVEAVTARLRAVLGLPDGQDRPLVWDGGGPAPMAALLGPGSAGAIDVVPLPAGLRGRLTPGTMPVSFAVDDLDERVAACRAAGLSVTVDAGGDAAGLPCAVVTVAGLEFELVATDF